MNREQKRALARTNKKHIDAAAKYLEERQAKTLNDGRAEAMYLLFFLALHRVEGFGRKKCIRVGNYIDDLMLDWRKEKIGLDMLRQQVRDNIGISIDL